MALFIDTSGMPDSVFSDLFAIVLKDGGLGEGNDPVDSTVFDVSYDQTLSAVTADRIGALVNSAANVVITGLASDAIGPDGSPIKGNGLTFQDSSGTIRVAYDVEQCDGNGIWTVGQDGSHIPTPGPVVLYHELSHAWHYATGTVASTDEQEEINAETDENDMRSELGLPLRKITDHTGGCGGVAAEGGCFIVTAAYGSQAEERVDRLRSVRDRVLRVFPAAEATFKALHREYYRFSPRVARQMRDNDALRERIRAQFVEPLSLFFELAVAQLVADGHGFGRPTPIVLRELADTADQHAQLPRDEMRILADLLSGLASAETMPTDAVATVNAHSNADPSTTAMPADLAHMVVLEPFPDAMLLVRWALAEPLAEYWQELAAGSTADSAAARMSRFVNPWIDGMPDLPGVGDAGRDAVLSSLKEGTDVS